MFARLCLLLLVSAVPASAQTLFQGRIDIVVQDAQGSVMPGATVEISGPATQTRVTDERGEAHFLNLPPGTYTVTATLQGFRNYTNDRVTVASGAGTPLDHDEVGGVAESVQVTGAEPIVDPARQTVTTSISYEELQQIPSSRDPWVVLQTIPGIVVDRVNVGGAESGQQSNYIAKGAVASDNTWNIDGIPITDLAATGSSPTYYAFDMFQEMSVTTGGASATNPTAGAQLNMQFKGGSDRVAATAHYIGTTESLQSDNLPDELEGLAGPSGKGNRMKEFSDVGFDVGGPIVRGRWWAWGAYGRTDGTLFTLNGDPDRTLLENIAFKTSGQINAKHPPGVPVLPRQQGEERARRQPAAGTRIHLGSGRTDAALQGPGQLSSRAADVFINGRFGYVGNNFSFTPLGGDASAYRDAGRVRRGNYYSYATDRPDYSAHVDGNWFRDRHEITFGGSWRNTRTMSSSSIRATASTACMMPTLPALARCKRDIWRPFFAASESHHAEFLCRRHHALRPTDRKCRVAVRSQRCIDARKRAARQSRLPDAAAGDCGAGRRQPDRFQPVVTAHRRELRA